MGMLYTITYISSLDTNMIENICIYGQNTPLYQRKLISSGNGGLISFKFAVALCDQPFKIPGDSDL